MEKTVSLCADLALVMAAIREAKADYGRLGFRTSAADVAEIRAGRFMALHGEQVLKMVSASERNMAVTP